MKLLSKIFILFVGNVIGLYLASILIKSGFFIEPSLTAYAEIAGILTLINIFIRPILKLILSPIIFITLGVGVIVVNVIVLYLLDYLSPQLTISGLYPYVYATLIIGIINFVLSFSAKQFSKES